MRDAEIRLLAELHPSQGSMARELGFSREWVRRLCDRAGIVKFRKSGVKSLANSLDSLPAWVLALLTARDAATLLGVPEKSLQGRRHFARRSLHFRVQTHVVRILWAERWTGLEIAESLGVTARVVYGIVHFYRARGLRFDRRYKTAGRP